MQSTQQDIQSEISSLNQIKEFKQIVEKKNNNTIKPIIWITISLLIVVIMLVLLWYYFYSTKSLLLIIISWNNTALGQPKNIQNLQSQTYGNWRAIYFRKSRQKSNLIESSKIKIHQLSNNKQDDVYNLITTQANEQTIFLLLNEDENLTTINQLQKIVDVFKDKDIFAGILDYKYKRQIKRGFSNLVQLRSNIHNLQTQINILNYLRVFRYQILQQTDNYQASQVNKKHDINRQFHKIVESDSQQMKIYYFNWPVFSTISQQYFQNDKPINQNTNKTQQIVSQNTQIQKNPIVQFCIISVKSSNNINYDFTFESIQKQTYQHWKTVFYISDQNETKIRRQEMKQIYKNKSQLLESSGNQGRDIYDGIVNQCSFSSIIIIINEGEEFYNQKTLEKYKLYFQNQKIFMAAVPFEHKGKTIKPVSLQRFRRDNYFPMQGHINLSEIKALSLNMMQTIRLFRSQIYQRLQYIDLMYQNQTFYREKVSFLYPLIQFRCKNKCQLFADQNNFVLPQIFQIIKDNEPFYKALTLQSIQNDQQFIQIGRKMIYTPAQDIINFAQRKYPHGNPPSHNPLMWDTHLNILKRNISDTQKIPRIVHQIWVGKEIPGYKKKFMNRVKAILQTDGFKYILWGNQNITKQNFPLTYNYLQKLIEMDKTSQYPKQAMMADLMRYQVVYHHGGFYLDTNYELFRNISSFLKYPFVGMMEIPPNLGQYLANSFFGAIKNSKYLYKILQPQILSTIKLEAGAKTNFESGPVLLARGFYPQDYYYDVKVFPPQKIYPYIRWAYDKRFKSSRCSFGKNQKIPQSLSGKYDQIIIANQYQILHPCKLYPEAYGIDHWNLGGSWKKPRF